MVTPCILIVLSKVPSNRQTASGQVSDEFPRNLDFSMSPEELPPCLHARWRPALLLWLASACPRHGPRVRSGFATARLCPITDCVYPMTGGRSGRVDPTSASCSIARSWQPCLCPVAAPPDAWRRRLLEGLPVQPRGCVRLLQWGICFGCTGDRTKINETEIVPKRFGLHHGMKGEPTS